MDIRFITVHPSYPACLYGSNRHKVTWQVEIENNVVTLEREFPNLPEARAFVQSLGNFEN